MKKFCFEFISGCVLVIYCNLRRCGCCFRRSFLILIVIDWVELDGFELIVSLIWECLRKR